MLFRSSGGAAPGGGEAQRARGSSSVRARLLAYVALTKPRIVELLLITTVPAMFLAARGVPSAWLVAATLVGGTLSAASANVFNCIFDADIDAQMTRTKGRPLVAGSVDPGSALAFATLLGVASFAWLALTTTTMAALLSLLAIGFYVLVYTLILKRSTPQNIVIGGAAGALPPVIGWAAVTGSVDLVPLILFAIVFFWTPPHFWALAILKIEDYGRAGVPMLPNVAGLDRTRLEILLYTLVLAPLGLAPWLLGDRKSTRLNSSHIPLSRMPSSA